MEAYMSDQKMEDAQLERKKRRKKGLFSVVFSRKVIMISLVLLQVLGLWALFSLLSTYVVYVYGVFLALEIILVTYILNRGGDSAFQISWLVLIMASPVVGILFYLFVKSQLGTRKLRERLKVTLQDTESWLQQSRETWQALEEKEPDSIGIAGYLKNFAGFPTYQNTEATYFSSGEEMFPELLRRLEAAEKYIFLEFFIVEQGEMWDQALAVLARKAGEGVEVRLIYDGSCTLSLLPIRYPKMVESLGIHCRVFAPIRPVFSTVQNNRDHRKIVVIDGYTAFTGGVNMADEYINRKERFGYWKDAAVMLQGEAVSSFTTMFLQMWNLYGDTPDHGASFIPPKETLFRKASGFVLPYGDNPLDDEKVGELVYLDILNRAGKYVHIFTPYLILDQEMVHALQFAAKRGVDVSIIVPHIPDKRYVYLLAWVYYEMLIPGGVKIYEFEPGFVHAKCFVSDDRTAVVGTVNMDFRSMYLHFECGVYMKNVPAVKMVEEDFQATLEHCRRITETDLVSYPWYKKLLGYSMRVVAPQL